MAIAAEAAAHGKRIIWGAPTYSQVRIGFNETKQAAGNVGTFNVSRMETTFPLTGGMIAYRSLDDPDNVRGETADGVIIDECADVVEPAWYEVLRPMLVDTGGWLWAIGTPKGRNWFWREHMGAADHADSIAWQIPTVGARIEGTQLVRAPHPLENPDIPFGEIENLWRTMPSSSFRQEILAEFIENEGAVFRNIGACMNAPDAQPGDHSNHRIVAGVDWGKQADFTAISIGCADCHVEIARDRFNQQDYVLQRARLAALCEQWKPQVILAEQNSIGDPIIEVLQREGLPVVPFQTTASTKSPLIENLALALERTEWQFQGDPVWTAELEAYERTVSPATGRSSYSAPAGLHDDTVIARALMLWAANARNAGPSIVIYDEPVYISPY